MRLKSATARMFRNILDSSEVEIDEKVTAIVGKNESGKTSFLTALDRLNPARTPAKFAAASDYPAWLEKRHRHQGLALGDVRPIEAVFVATDDDRSAWSQTLGEGVLSADTVTASRSYADEFHVDGYTLDERAAVVRVLASAGVAEDQATSAFEATTVAQLESALPALEAAGGPTASAAAAIEAALTTYLQGKTLEQLAFDLVRARIPRLFYFANYSSLPKQIKIRDLLHRAKSSAGLNDEERTAVALLRLAATDDEFLLNVDYELRKRELENVANAITDDVLTYWSQNPDLRVHIDITQVPQPPHQAALDELKVRVWDDRHRLSLPFGGRSSGFQWFFSFLAAFSEYENSPDPIVILLDEPALGLHARAQADFLRFIDERLAPKHQVIYTTHSPFMVPPGRLERVRVVEDAGREKGSRISSNVLATDPDTLFPLQGALGYDLAQHLFVAPDNLVVEGTSDLIYLTTLSDHLASLGRASLDPRWSIVPVGGADKVPTFVALLGQHLDVTVLVDSQKAGHQKLTQLENEKILEKRRVLTVGGILGLKLADIEDAFHIDDYLRLYNGAFQATLTGADLSGNDSIVARIARHLGVDRFDHGKPADFFLRTKADTLPLLRPETLDQFEALIVAINKTLEVRR